MKIILFTILLTLMSYSLLAQSGRKAIDKKKEAIGLLIENESYDKALSELLKLEELLGEDDLFVLEGKITIYSYLGDFAKVLDYGNIYFEKDSKAEDNEDIVIFYGIALISLLQQEFDKVKSENSIEAYQGFLLEYSEIYDMLGLGNDDLEYAKNKIEEIPLYSETDEIFYQAEQMPEFPGGAEAMQQHIRKELSYPEEAQKSNIKGRVFVRFIVEKQGLVSGVEVVRTIHPLLDKEAVRVVQSFPEFKPGRSGGKIVRVAMILPVNFDF